MKVSKRVEDYVRSEINKAFSNNSKFKKLHAEKAAEMDRMAEFEKKLNEKLSKICEEECKAFGLVRNPNYTGTLSNLYSARIECSLGSNNYRNWLVTERLAEIDKQLSEERNDPTTVYNLTQQVCLQMELGGKTLDDLNELIANAVKENK